MVEPPVDLSDVVLHPSQIVETAAIAGCERADGSDPSDEIGQESPHGECVGPSARGPANTESVDAERQGDGPDILGAAGDSSSRVR
jgi:hypothetical protein